MLFKIVFPPESRGDPERALRWTTKSTRTLAAELVRRGYEITHSVVAKMLASMGYSLQGASKVLEGESHPDRDAQFRYIADLVEEFRILVGRTVLVAVCGRGSFRLLPVTRV
jgi:hypothetical protein